MIALVIGLTVITASQIALSDDAESDLSSLTSEQAEYVARMLDVISRTEQKLDDIIVRMNGSIDKQSKSFEYEHANYDVTIARGDVIEKAGFTLTTGKLGNPPLTQEVAWSRGMTIDIHPKTPHVGLLHAFLNMQISADGKGTFGGWMDVVHTVSIEEDLSSIRESVDDVLEKYGRDVVPYRKAACTGPREILQAACVGLMFFVPPMLEINEENFNLVTETFEAIFDSYIATLDKRKDQDFTEEDIAAQDDMRKRWMEDQFLHDPFAKNVIPYEVWSLANQPPTVKF
jgi:coproporphyrinogen III oxidase